MPFCAAFGCASVHKKGCGMSFFSFPKDSVRRKTWTIYCRRDKFVPENHSRLCSKHFSKDQVERDPNVLERLGYANARIRLKKDAVPDVPLRLQLVVQEAASLALPPKTRGAFAKRNKPYVSLSFISYDLKNINNIYILHNLNLKRNIYLHIRN